MRIGAEWNQVCERCHIRDGDRTIRSARLARTDTLIVKGQSAVTHITALSRCRHIWKGECFERLAGDWYPEFLEGTRKSPWKAYRRNPPPRAGREPKSGPQFEAACSGRWSGF